VAFQWAFAPSEGGGSQLIPLWANGCQIRYLSGERWCQSNHQSTIGPLTSGISVCTAT
jgi:hypothetical protein